jgi:hypothetical protein
LDNIGVKIIERSGHDLRKLLFRKALPPSIFPSEMNDGLRQLGLDFRKIPSLSQSSYLIRDGLKKLNLSPLMEFALSLQRLREGEYDNEAPNHQADWQPPCQLTATPPYPMYMDIEPGLQALVSRKRHPLWPVVVLDANLAPAEPLTTEIKDFRPMENYHPVMFMGTYKRLALCFIQF